MLQPGQVLAQRYEILQILGEGGMGAVYKAKDLELDRPVALKVIRPDLAGSQAILDRFKQELLLAREITHKNVIRIYDIGEAEGLKFITMEFVEGEDLRTLIHEKKKIPPLEAVEIMQQVCRALEAAHSVGIIHRDLKPQNVMCDKTGRILVMDFGLARTLEGDGMTQTGALVGTMDYMSPEQALGKELDQRSDLFALGLIFYELLTGKMPYKADSVVARLLKRTQERAAPVSSHDASIPHALSNIVSKCMEPDTKLRYQTVAEILADLETWQGGAVGATLHFPSGFRPWGRSYPWRWVGAAVAVLVLATAGYLLRAKLLAPPVAPTSSGPVVSLAIVPFRNASGDASLDWLGSTLAEMLNMEVGQSARVRTISPDRVHQVLSDLRISPSTIIDAGTLGRLAESSSADTVVSGQFVRFGNQIRIDATLQDLKHERRVPLQIDAGSEKDIPDAASRLADTIRQNLPVSPDVVKELKSSSFQPSSKSVVALREYSHGSELLRNGKNLDAVKELEAATRDDPGFSLALSKLAQAYANLGHDNEAEQASKKAMELAENLPEAEKYVVAAAHAQIVRDYGKAIQAYETLAHLSPDNSDVQLTLARNYENANDFANARKHYERVLALNPKDIAALAAMGRVEVMSGNDQASLDPLTRALSLAIRDDNQEQRALVLHLLGMAYADLNKSDEALLSYQQSLEIRRRLGQKQGTADTLNMIALLYVGLGKYDLALKNYKEALQTYRDIGDKQDAGTVLLNIGQFYDDHGKYDDALKLFKESLQIQREVGNESNQALCLNNIGNTYLFKADYENARTYFEQALQLREKFGVSSDIADTLHNLAETDVMTGQYDQALTRYLRALDLRRSANDKQGAAKESDSLGMVFEYQGRYGAAVKARGEAVNTFRELRDRSYWMAITLSSYGESLLQVGRFEDATKTWNEALSLARELKNRFIIAQISNWQGDSFLYRGDFQSATPLIQTALQMARGTGDHHLILQSRLDSAKLALKRGQSRAAIQALRDVVAEADSLGLKHLAIESTLLYAEALITRRDYPQAQAELQRASEQSDNLGLRMLSARGNFLMGKLLLAMDKPADAGTRFQATVRILDDIRKESGAETLLQRPDLMSMYTEASYGSHLTGKWSGKSTQFLIPELQTQQ
jgi:tetratricopeptide (TPR) repeat protein/predicted Ser/Thr protein kinase